METLIQRHRGDEDCTTCRLCQQHFTTPRRLRVHVPQHFITTFCPCGEYSYHRDYILRHRRTMDCHTGHLHDVDETSFPTFLGLIKPFISDLVCYERLSQGFPAPRAVTHGPVPKPPGYKKSASPPAHTVPRPPAGKSPHQEVLAITCLLLLGSDGGNLPHLPDTPPLPETSGKWSKGLTISNRRHID